MGSKLKSTHARPRRIAPSGNRIDTFGIADPPRIRTELVTTDTRLFFPPAPRRNMVFDIRPYVPRFYFPFVLIALSTDDFAIILLYLDTKVINAGLVFIWASRQFITGF